MCVNVADLYCTHGLGLRMIRNSVDLYEQSNLSTCKCNIFCLLRIQVATIDNTQRSLQWFLPLNNSDGFSLRKIKCHTILKRYK